MKNNTIYTIELSHKSAPIEIREMLNGDPETVMQTLKMFKNEFKEIFILATCNRFAFYCYGNNITPILSYFEDKGISQEKLFVHENDLDSSRHLFRTAAGLESQIIGEQQILGQLKRAYHLAKEAKTIGPVLDEFIRESIHVSKKVKEQTNVSRYSNSAASACFQIITNMYGNLTGNTVLIIGTGKIASIALSIVKKTNVKKVIVASHNIERARIVANKLNIEAITVEQIMGVFPEVDIVIGGTHKEIKFWTDEQIEDSGCPREVFGMLNERRRLFIDLGVPRNFNPELKRVPNVFLFDLDHIAFVKDDALDKRMEAVPVAENLITQEVGKYMNKLKDRKMNGLYASYWKQLEKIKKQNLEWLKPKLKNNSDQQWDLMERFTHKLIRQIGRTPTNGIRALIAEDQFSEQALQTVSKIHNLELDNDTFDEYPKGKSSYVK